MNPHQEISKIHLASQITGHVFGQDVWICEALQAPGSPVTSVGSRILPEGNKRLAGLGRTVMSLIIVERAVDENITIGDTSERLQKLSRNEQLANFCDNIGLSRCITRNPSQQGTISPRTKADTIEAVLGAVYKDGGLDAVDKVLKYIGFPTRAPHR
ncbi:hypothetical protein LX32DRAFT_205506 [Colletotrichum zoysiae]|uniref:RNase III domain-containing protein n=1 Tax=Colletotrichum zoysiae TaxID=1216348 RepID=A0AAD9H5I6_9PEZI|nr:hypothetical protein LX32DRAFT_205506 [Colletotrichum zoysiae]